MADVAIVRYYGIWGGGGRCPWDCGVGRFPFHKPSLLVNNIRVGKKEKKNIRGTARAIVAAAAVVKRLAMMVNGGHSSSFCICSCSLND